MKKNVMIGAGIFIAVIIMLIASNGSDVKSISNDMKNEQITNDNNSPTVESIYELYDKPVYGDTNNFLRNPDQYSGQMFRLDGIVEQVIEEGDLTTLIVTDDVFGGNVALGWKRAQGEHRYLKGDHIASIVEFIGVENLQSTEGPQEFAVVAVHNINFYNIINAALCVYYVQDGMKINGDIKLKPNTPVDNSKNEYLFYVYNKNDVVKTLYYIDDEVYEYSELTGEPTSDNLLN